MGMRNLDNRIGACIEIDFLKKMLILTDQTIVDRLFNKFWLFACLFVPLLLYLLPVLLQAPAHQAHQ